MVRSGCNRCLYLVNKEIRVGTSQNLINFVCNGLGILFIKKIQLNDKLSTGIVQILAKVSL